jgi:hypothetical protein
MFAVFWRFEPIFGDKMVIVMKTTESYLVKTATLYQNCFWGNIFNNQNTDPYIAAWSM